jgi:alpha-pyrone synthase
MQEVESLMSSQSYITHIGTAIPPHRFTQQYCVDYFSQHGNLSSEDLNKLRRVYRGTAINERHFVIDFYQNPQQYQENFSLSDRMKLFELHAAPLALQAIRNSDIAPSTLESVTHLIIVSCTGMYAPGMDIEIIKAFHLPTHVARTYIHFMGCMAAVNALKTADAICRSHDNARILIVSVELCSLHFQLNHVDDQLIANALFADGAACVLVQNKPLSAKNLRLEKFYSNIIPDSADHMAWSIRDEGFLIKLSAFIPVLLSRGIQELVQPMMDAYGTEDLSHIDHFAIHPGGPKILEKIEKVLGIASAQNANAHEILKNYGNMSSVTLLFILKNLLHTVSEESHNKKVLSMAFGPGLSLESALLQIVFG